MGRSGAAHSPPPVAASSCCGGAAGLPSLAALPPLLPRLAVPWQMSAQRKRQEEAERIEAGASSSGRQGLQAAPSGKGDRFFSNLMPSFVKR